MPGRRPAAPSRAAGVAAAVAAALLAAACTGGSADSGGPTTAPGGTGTGASALAGGTSTSGGPTTTVPIVSTTLSKYISAGERHDLPGGGTISVSYPRYPLRQGKDQPPPPPGSVYAVLSVKICAPKDKELVGLAEPARFKVEVPGQGFVSWSPSTPEIRRANLAPGTVVAPDTCVTGNVHYAIAGEMHIEAVLYDTGDGVLRWAS